MNQLIEEKIKEALLKINNVYATVFQLSGYDADQLKEKENTIKDFIKTSLNEVVDKTLEDYTVFLVKNNYCDDDVWCEEPTAIERFKEDVKKLIK